MAALLRQCRMKQAVTRSVGSYQSPHEASFIRKDRGIHSVEYVTRWGEAVRDGGVETGRNAAASAMPNGRLRCERKLIRFSVGVHQNDLSVAHRAFQQQPP